MVPAKTHGGSRLRVLYITQIGVRPPTFVVFTAGGKAAYSKWFEPLPPGFIHVPFNDLEAIKAVTNDRTVAIFLEPVLGAIFSNLYLHEVLSFNGYLGGALIVAGAVIHTWGSASRPADDKRRGTRGRGPL